MDPAAARPLSTSLSSLDDDECGIYRGALP